MAFVSAVGALRTSSFTNRVCSTAPAPVSRPRRHTRARPPRCTAVVTTQAERKASLLEALKAVQDPDLGEDIVTLGFVKDVSFEPVADGLYDVRFVVELTTPACPVKEQFRSDCKRLAEALPFVRDAEVVMTAQPPASNVESPQLQRIGAVIAVASCKGGVGKSTTAVNLAFALAANGARVGLFDADIYGPSLPTLVTPDQEQVFFEGRDIKPLMARGVKLMSFGYINPNAAVMRGPMIAGLMTQLLTTTAWGELDYLVIDMPPGTGDIQLTLCQTLRITAAVIVTTPQKLATVDVVKGVEMFQKVRVSSVAVVENMAYFRAPDTGKVHYLFGKGQTDVLRERFNISCMVQIPVEPQLSVEEGVPYVVGAQSETAQKYGQLAEGVVREVARIQHGGSDAPEVSWEDGDVVIRRKDGREQRIWAADLRRACKCAQCMDEMTGRPLLDPKSVKEDVRPLRIERVGNYAVEIDWSDGHASLYPYSRFVKPWGDETASEQDNGVAEPALAARKGVETK